MLKLLETTILSVVLLQSGASLKTEPVLLHNFRKDIWVVSDQKEPLESYFQRHKLVVTQLSTIDAKIADPKIPEQDGKPVFVSFLTADSRFLEALLGVRKVNLKVTQNHSFANEKSNARGALRIKLAEEIEILPVPPDIARWLKSLIPSDGRKQMLYPILSAAKHQGGANRYELVGLMLRSPILYFEGAERMPPETFDPNDQGNVVPWKNEEFTLQDLFYSEPPPKNKEDKNKQ